MNWGNNMDKEKLEHHLQHLQQRHAELEKKIKEGYSHYLDDEHLGKIKHEKLGVKREIAKIEDNLKNVSA
jgi:hypothetical protein